jgi:hypothetical protein
MTCEKPTEKADKQIQYTNNDEHMKLRNNIHELEKEKLTFAGRLH